MSKIIRKIAKSNIVIRQKIKNLSYTKDEENKLLKSNAKILLGRDGIKSISDFENQYIPFFLNDSFLSKHQKANIEEYEMDLKIVTYILT